MIILKVNKIHLSIKVNNLPVYILNKFIKFKIVMLKLILILTKHKCLVIILKKAIYMKLLIN